MRSPPVERIDVTRRACATTCSARCGTNANRPDERRSHRFSDDTIGIGAVRESDRSPPTPPGMRVRTGRFEQLRS
ncbi:hypothetical protein D5R55_05375 [Burkholderia cenocepacia]|uniref:Uncharacterized protein n=1 Tax=Burkholderia cenocepacia TaxID=95486 RepID=A0A3S9N3U8_9BURK|nr:hypothetical protein D5R55_05375 [Burkholderia cenocepacia]